MTTSAARPPHSKQSTDLVAVAEESAREHQTMKEPYAPPKQKLVTRTEQQCYQLHRRIVDH